MKRNSFIALLCAVFMIAGTTACQEVIEPTPDQTEQEENKDQNDVPTDEEAEEQVNTGVVRSMAFISVTPNNELEQATVQLASKGLTVKNGTYTGTGVFLNLVIRTEKDEAGVVYLAEGEYAAAENTAEELTWQVTAKDGEALTGSYVVAVIKGEATEVELTEGTATVSKGTNAEGAEEYTIVVKADKYDLTYTGAIEGLNAPVEPEPEQPEDPEQPEQPEPEQPAIPANAQLTTCISAQSNVANGTYSVTLNLGTDGISSTMDPQTWQTTWTGEGGYLALDIYSADGTLVPGTYKACAAGGQIGEGEFGIGWDPGDLWNMGMVFENWGTCWWNVANGAATAAGKVLDGTITVALDGNVYTITLKSSLLNATYKGEITGLELPSASVVELNTFLSFTSNVANGTNSVTINLGTEGISSTMDPQTWQTTWTGEGSYLALDVYSADGTLAPGTYTACAAGGQIGAGEFGIGWDPGDLWGIGMVFENWGTCWWSVSGGAATAIGKVLDGTLTVAVEGDVYTITLESSLLNATYTGLLAAATPEQPEQPEQPEASTHTIMPKFLALAPQGSQVSLYVGQETQTYANYSVTGEGDYFKCDIYSADGTLAPGTYTASAVGGQIAEGEFSIGYDAEVDWGFGPMVMPNWGSCLMTKAADGSETGVKVTDGTITVEKDGDTYTITVTSTAVNIKYVGPLAQ